MPGEQITPRRCSLPCAPTSPYGRISPAHSPEPFNPRLSGEYRHPRRGDSRLSDNTAFGRMTDEIPPLFRRPGSGFGRSHRHHDAYPSRYSKLDSVEDSTVKASSVCQDEISERDDDTQQTDVEEKENQKDTTPELDDISVTTEGTFPIDNENAANPKDALLRSEDSVVIQL